MRKENLRLKETRKSYFKRLFIADDYLLTSFGVCT